MFSRTLFVTCFLCAALVILSACKTNDTTQDTKTKVPSIGTIVVEPIVPTTTAIENSHLTITPSLPKDDAYLLLVDLLRNNKGCDLPCWWGITPSISSSSDAYTTLVTFKSIAYDGLLYPTGGVIDITYPKDELLIKINVKFHSDSSGLITRMLKISTQVLRDLGNRSYEEIYDSSSYIELLNSYSLANILAKYGRPSQVLLRADIYNYTQSRETFEVTLLYPEKGIYVRYNSVAERVASNIIGCPSMAFVELWLLSPDDKDSYDEFLSVNDATWEGNFPYTKPVEEAALMTVEEFYQTFREPTNNCLKTPLDIWLEQ